MSEYRLEIVADYNNGDYITRVSHIDQETLDKVKKVIPEIKNRGVHNAEGLYTYLEDKFDCEIADWFTDLCPYEEYVGIHTIKSITLSPLTTETKLF